MLLNITLFTFLFCLIIQSLFFLIIFSRLAFYKPYNVHNIPATPVKVTIVVAVHNEYLNLLNLLPVLFLQEGIEKEIIIVDDRSDDGTTAYLNNLQKEVKELKHIIITHVPEGISPKKHALTKGIEEASHSLILLTDADCLPLSNKWANLMTRSMIGEKYEACIGYSPYLKNKSFLNILIRYETFYTAIQYLSLCLSGFPYMGVGRNMSYKRSLFLKNNGYENHLHILSGDDDLFGNKAFEKGKVDICLLPESLVSSIPKTTYFSWLKQKTRHLSAGLHYRFTIKLILGTLILSHFLFYLTALLLLCKPQFAEIVIIGYIFRCSIFLIVFKLIERQLHENFRWYMLPILDFIYILNYILVSLNTIFAKKVKWT